MGAKSGDKATKAMHSYDIVAVKPAITSEQTFEQICSKAEVDIIQVECGERMAFYI